MLVSKKSEAGLPRKRGARFFFVCNPFFGFPASELPSRPAFQLSRLHQFMKMKKRIVKWLLIGLLLVLAYAVFVEPFWVRTKVFKIKDKNFVDFFKLYK